MVADFMAAEVIRITHLFSQVTGSMLSTGLVSSVVEVAFLGAGRREKEKALTRNDAKGPVFAQMLRPGTREFDKTIKLTTDGHRFIGRENARNAQKENGDRNGF